MTHNIHFVMGREELVDNIADLWRELNEVHRAQSPYFAGFYAHRTFEERKASLLSAAQTGQLCVVLAYDEITVVGYCIASVIDDTGEIDSIFVSQKYRKMGIADTMMNRVLAWIEQNDSTHVSIKVSVGNEQVFGFYARHGFYPRLTELQRLPK